MALLLLARALAPLKAVRVKMLPFDNKSEFQVIVDIREGTPLERTLAATAATSSAGPLPENHRAYPGTAGLKKQLALLPRGLLHSPDEVEELYSRAECMKLGRRQFVKYLAIAAGALHSSARSASRAAGETGMNPDRSYDVAVIGAGVFGAWTAYHLARSGKKVVLLDAYGPANSRASSAGESRIIRMGYGPDEIYMRSAARSLELWQEFFRRVDRPLFHRTGVLWMAGADDRYIRNTLETLSRVGVRFERLEKPELEKRYPQIAFVGVAWGLLEPQSGALMARQAVQAVVEQAQKDGVHYLRAAVAPPGEKNQPGRLSEVCTSAGETIRATSFVFACGPWLGKVFPELLSQRIFPTRQEVFFFGVPGGDRSFAPPAMPTWIALADEMYGILELEGRGFKIALDGHGPSFDPDQGSRVTTPEGLEAVRQYLAKRFPRLKDAPVVETRVCQYENTSNGDFLIDRHPDWENVWLVGGGSGHGFKHGPALGEYVAARLEGTGTAEPRFSLASKQKVQKRAVY